MTRDLGIERIVRRVFHRQAAKSAKEDEDINQEAPTPDY
jgi:hypothetical protein